MPKLSLNASKKTKHTPAGEIPVDWGWATLDDVTSRERRVSYGIVQTGENLAGGIPCVRVTDLINSRLDIESMIRTSPRISSSYKRTILEKGDIIFALRGDIGKTAIADERLVGANLTRGVALIAANKAKAQPEFLRFALEAGPTNTAIRLSVNGTSLKEIPINALRQIPIPLPPLPEQRRIADILSTWDRTIETLESVIAAKERRKQALMQQLFTGRKRLPGFNQSKGLTNKDRFETYPADWEHLRLGQVVTETGKRNSLKGDHPVLSCTKHQGLVLSEEYFGRRVHAEDTSNYRVVRRGEFAYATNHIEEGSIGYQDLCDAGLVSPIYTVFKPNKTISPSYLFRVLKSPLFLHLYQTNTSASVDRRGSLRFKEFAQLPIWLPSMKEQEAISSVFDTADRELTLHRQHLATLRTQKRGLMQLLLTGRVRVKTT